MRHAVATVLVASLSLAACGRQQAPPAQPVSDAASPPAASTPAPAPATAPAAPVASAPDAVPVTADNFGRAASDLTFAHVVKDGGYGKFHHNRELTPLDNQIVIRQNRDTLYSSGVFDLDAGPVTITLPDPGTRFMSMQVFDEDQYTHQVAYKPGTYTLRKADIGTRYVMPALRILVDPSNPEDMKVVHALQDAVKVSQPGGPGTFEIPKWDTVSLGKLTDALTVLGDTLPDKNHMFGMKQDVDPVRRLIGVATAWGGNPAKDATYLNIVPPNNDGKTVYHLDVKDVPVDGFWSVTVYNAKGYFDPNPLNAYSVNNLTAKKADDGSVRIQFGGCEGQVPNCLPITPGWNYMVRLYRPRAEFLDGNWKFPEAVPAS